MSPTPADMVQPETPLTKPTSGVAEASSPGPADLVERLEYPSFPVPIDMPAKDKLKVLIDGQTDLCHEAAIEIRQLREWKDSVLSKCQHSDGWAALSWGGDKTGWGFVHYYIGHLETRALDSEAKLAPLGDTHEWLVNISNAARIYYERYAQDEAADREDCISDQQHEDAKALRDALAATGSQG